MNKLGFIKYVLILACTFLFLHFIAITTSIQNVLISLLFLFPVAITIFMFFNRNKARSHKHIYNIILMLLIAYFMVVIAFYAYSRVSCFFDVSCLNDFEADNVYLFIVLSSLMLLSCFKDIYSKTDIKNDILTVIACLLIIFIYTRYYLDTKFIHQISKDDIFILHSYGYITQNYIYFSIMYFTILLHKLINNKTMNNS